MSSRDKPISNSAGAYSCIVPRAQEIARPLGYAIAVHGSMNRDLDLVAIPWVQDAAPAEELHAALIKAFSWCIGKEGLKDPGFQREQKPHGRSAWMIPLAAGLSIDLSVMPRIQPVYKDLPKTTLRRCPPGLFKQDGKLVGFKSEYGTDAYTLRTGEYFWGGVADGDHSKRNNLKVTPVELVSKD